MSITPNYEGKFAFLEQVDPKSTYGNGEYFIVRQTPATLYCCKLVGGYCGHNLEAKPLIGAQAWRVIETWEDDSAAETAAREMIEWGNQSKAPDFKRQWVDYVYTECTRNGEAVLRTLKKKSRSHLPPAEPTQREKDEEAMGQWVPFGIPTYGDCWHAALAYERAEVMKLLDNDQSSKGLAVIYDAIRARCTPTT